MMTLSGRIASRGAGERRFVRAVALAALLAVSGCVRYQLRRLEPDDAVCFAALHALLVKAKAHEREAPVVFCVAVGGGAGKHRDPGGPLLHNLRAERDDVRTQSQCARACIERTPLCAKNMVPLHLGAIEWESPDRAVVAGSFLSGFHREGACFFRVQRAGDTWKVADELCPGL